MDIITAGEAGIENRRLRAISERIARDLAARERDEVAKTARSAPFSRVPLWASFLPVTRRQALVLGRIYSFQCSVNKDGSRGEYRMGLGNGARELHMDRDNFKHDLGRLVSLGLVTRHSNGPRRPSTYLVDEAACVTEARRNGWDG